MDKDDAARKEKLVTVRRDMQQRLEEQIKEREAAKQEDRRREEVKFVVFTCECVLE
jgi:hypothetical protein